VKLQTLDLLIILAYLVAVIGIGVVLQKRAAKSMDSYFLGGKTLPWYMLGLSNASGMFDISGTMWMVTLMFVYGVKSLWIPWLWPVFNQIFLMIYLSAWLRRSNVLTGAEWIRLRFGDGLGGRLSHMVVVFFAVVGVIGFLSYGFIGVGKFIEIFIPWESVARFVPFPVAPQYVPHFYGVIFTAITTLYVILGGMLSIVWADVMQFLIMFVAAIVIGVIAMMRVDATTLEAMVPAGWLNPFFGWNLHLDWSQQLASVNQKIAADGFSLFGLFFMMMLFKGIFASLAGPAPNYDMQKILSTRNPAEACKMSGFVSLVLLFPRYFMITGFAVLAIVFFRADFLAMGDNPDFEKVLPMAINAFVPTGLMGLLLAGLFAAFMGTFASTVNAAPAYLINDVYLRYINPKASRKQLIYGSYLVSILVVVLSTVIGFFVTSINDILQWIVSALWGGYVAANVLKWHWWRFNGHGYFWGMLSGVIASMIFPLVFPHALPLYYFPLLLMVSLAGCLIGTYATPPTEDQTLVKFYRTTRPWGFWKPVHDKVAAADPTFVRNTHFKRDMFNVAVGILWQSALTIVPIYVVLKQKLPLAVSVGILVITSLVLKRNWYDRLQTDSEAESASAK
jgi:solute:Na+ symporter, SSS family